MGTFEEDVRAYQRRLDALGARCTELEGEKRMLQGQIAVLEAEAVQWKQQKVLQEQIIAQRLATADGEKQELLREVERLQNEKRELRG